MKCATCVFYKEDPDIPPGGMKCSTCVFYKEDKPNSVFGGVCRRYPPLGIHYAFPDGDIGGTLTKRIMFTETHPDELCGEYRPQGNP